MTNELNAALESELKALLALPCESIRPLVEAVPALDAIEAAYVDNPNELPSQSGDHPESKLYELLGHITADQSDPHSGEVLSGSYVYMNEGPKFTADNEEILNYDEATVRAFIEKLVEVASDLRAMIAAGQGTATAKNVDRCFWVTGTRGSGKTFFLNHALWKYADLLNQHHVVWVRINLVNPRGFDSDINHWMYAQIARILLAYYDPSSVHCTPEKVKSLQFFRHADSYINGLSEPADRKDRLRDSLDGMRRAFATSGAAESVSPGLCNKVLCQEIYEYALTNGLAFIVVFDGFDRLEIDSASIDRFKLIKQGLQALLSDDKIVGPVFVPVTRTDTWLSIYSLDPATRIGDGKRYLIHPVSIEPIFEARVDSLKAYSNKMRGLGGHHWNARDWGVLLDDFAALTINASKEDSLEALNETFSGNNRAKIQVIQQQFQGYLQKRTRTGYRLIDYMLKAGMRFPPIIYTYHRNGAIVQVSPARALFDNRFLPIISRPPLIAEDREAGYPGGWYKMESVLHGIRIIQLAIAHERFREGAKRKSESITVRELVTALNEVFGYQKDQTRLFIQQLFGYEVLRNKSPHTGQLESDFSYVVPTPKAAYLINTCIGDLAYLNFCAMRCPGRPNVETVSELFRAAYLESNGPTEPWTIAKVRNSFGMVALFSCVNKMQKRRFDGRNWIGNTDDRLQKTMHFAVNQDGFFSSIDAIPAKVLREAQRAANAIGKTAEKERLVRELKTLHGTMLGGDA